MPAYALHHLKSLRGKKLVAVCNINEKPIECCVHHAQLEGRKKECLVPFTQDVEFQIEGNFVLYLCKRNLF